MKKQAGFTLIELVAVLVILALLGAMAVPRFSNMQDDALTAAKQGSSMAVKSAHSIAIAKLKDLPDVDQLVTYVGGESTLTAVATGVQVNINGTDYIVPTYTDSTCSSATGNTTDQVGCVGSIP
ncbi:MAG: type II secretion system protein [Gammaproteobacteria bacterium]|nr:MAG: type II secretion system protein [Gammaproteobacteria bacterium]